MKNTAHNLLRIVPIALVLLTFVLAPAIGADSLIENPNTGARPDTPSDHPDYVAPPDGDFIPGAAHVGEPDVEDPPWVDIRPVLYDVRTRQERVIDRVYRGSDDAPVRTWEGSDGECDDGETIGAQGGGAIVFGDDGRSKISDTTAKPWRRIGKIYAWFHDPASDPATTRVRDEINFADCVGTGALIGDCHVLTAGHVIYNKDPDCGNLGWAEKVIFIPGHYIGGRGNRRFPYGAQYATQLMSWQGWTQDASDDHDMGFFVLDEAIGNTTGWFGYTTADSDGDIRNISGYPVDRNSGWDQFHMADDIKCENKYNLKYKIDTEGGQSGSPIWRYDGEDRHIVGVHAHGGVPNGCWFETQNRGVRITSAKFDAIQDWKASYECPEPEPDLGDDGDDDDDSGIDIGIIGKLIPIKIRVRNFGPRPAGRFRVAAFLSVDSRVSRDDIFLGTANVPDGLGCFQLIRLCIEARIPADIPPGRYYIGWYIDPDNLVDESNELNNVRVIPSREIVVVDPDNISVEQRDRIRRYLRGDANDDSKFDISDALRIVSHLFLGEAPPKCLRAADNNLDGRLDLSDAIDALNDLFLRSSPTRACAEGQSPETLGCGSYSHCQ